MHVMYRLKHTLFEKLLNDTSLPIFNQKTKKTEEKMEHTDKEMCIKEGCTVICLSARKQEFIEEKKPH